MSGAVAVSVPRERHVSRGSWIQAGRRHQPAGCGRSLGECREGDEEQGDSVRARYERHGAAAYYRQHASDYVNPHEPEVRQCIEMAAARARLLMPPQRAP